MPTSTALVGPPTSWRGLLTLCVPMAMAMGCGFFLHYANRTVLGWYSEPALAASLPAGMAAWTVQSFFIMLCGYLGTFAAQHTAAGEDRQAGGMVWPMMYIAGLAGVFCGVLLPWCWTLSGWFGVSPEVQVPMTTLLRWYLLETPLMAVAAGLSGFAGGVGRTGLVMALSIIGCVVCVGLNVWLVLGGLGVPPLGATGAGLASVLTTLLGAVYWSWWMLHGQQRQRYAVWAQRGFSLTDMRRFFRHAFPRGASEVLEMFSWVAFSMVIARLGTSTLAASNAAFSTYLVLLVPVIGFAQGVGIAVGQAQGAGRVDLARKNVARGLYVIAPYGLLICLLFLVLPEFLLTPMRGHAMDEAGWAALVHEAWPVCVGLGLCAVADASHHVWRFALNGAGDTRWPFVVMVLISTFGIAVPSWLTYVLVSDSRQVLWLCYMFLAGTNVLMMLAMWWRFQSGVWERMSVRR